MDQLVDKTEGNTFFHYFVSRSSESFPEDSYLFTFDQRDRFLNGLKQLNNPSVWEIGMALLDSQINFVRNQWADAEADQIPTILRVRLTDETNHHNPSS